MRLIPADKRFADATNATVCAGIFVKAFGATSDGVDWRKLRVIKALPHKNGGFALQYEAPLFSGGVYHVGGHLTQDPGQQPDWAGATSGTGWDAELGLAVATPISDPILGADFGGIYGKTGKVLGKGLGWAHDRVDPSAILTYRLAKRCVALIVDAEDKRQAVVKFARPKTIRAVTSAADHLAAARIAVPPILFRSPKDRFVAMDFVPGTGLHRLQGYPCVEAHRETGQNLRRLHEVLPGDLPPRTAQDELDQLDHWVSVVTAVFPEMAQGVDLCLRILRDRIPDVPRELATIHRDFYDKQIIVTGQGVVLLDFDTLAAGDPNLDLGNFLAHVRLRRKQYYQQEKILNLAGETFLSGYGATEARADDLAWWQAAAMLRLVVVYSLRPSWQQLIPSLLEDVHLCLRAPELPLG